MQIIIPMSGFGERFRQAGYTVPKPLIEIDGRPIIGHVIDMFPGETDFIFICNQDHLDEPAYRMATILGELCPTGRVIGIPPHKLGPVHAVLQIADFIDPLVPTVVNYCDFTCYWNWSDFKDFVQTTDCDGAIPAYKGFHPHSLGTTNYAYMREMSGWVQDIQEKQPYTENRLEEFASSGTYYFKSGQLLRDAFDATMEQGLNVGGEFYVSLAYKPLLANNAAIAVYPLQHFMQWGTPADVREYLAWSLAFQRMLSPREMDTPAGAVVVPMAGLGQRFVNEGYTVAKPLIPVSGRPMVAQATSDLPAALHHCFVLRADMPGYEEISAQLRQLYPGAVIETVSCVTQGQACTALIGLDALTKVKGAIDGPVTFGACDNGALYQAESFRLLTEMPEVDVIIWGIRGYANAVRHTAMYGWVAGENGKVSGISVKQPLGSPASDPIVLGTFTFRRAEDFRRIVESLMARDGRVNGEFYIDSCINDALALGLECRLLEVDSYLCWGTPNDLRTFEYWQSCFHKWAGHPYRLENDSRIPPEAVEDLAMRYAASKPSLPGKHT